jgi:hypothetical protein
MGETWGRMKALGALRQPLGGESRNRGHRGDGILAAV